MREMPLMEHNSHLTDSNDSGAFQKIIAAIVVAIALGAVGAYVMYGSGMWDPPVHHAAY